MGRGEVHAAFWWGNMSAECTVNKLLMMEDPSGYGRIILKWIFRKRDGGHGLD